MQQPQPRKKPVVLYIVIAVVVSCCGCGVLGSLFSKNVVDKAEKEVANSSTGVRKTDSKEFKIEPDAEVHIFSFPDGPSVHLIKDKEDYDKMNKIGGSDMVKDLRSRDEVIDIDTGTAATVLEVKKDTIDAVRVRITEGKKSGQEGWIGAPCVKP